LEGDLGSLNEEQRKFLEKTYASNERMIRLINDLLNVTRIEEGKFIYKPAPLQLEEIVQNVIAASQDKINFKAIELKYLKPAKKLPLIKMDMEKMQIAISNLLDNAVDYTPKKGKIAIELSIENNKVKFSIADTGVGIPKGQQHRIFSKFFRGENVVKMETDGTGLGTFITKNIIDAHGGEIWFDSKEGKGTTFYFTLPIS
jgi:signal transduction histidine kinase